MELTRSCLLQSGQSLQMKRMNAHQTPDQIWMASVVAAEGIQITGFGV